MLQNTDLFSIFDVNEINEDIYDNLAIMWILTDAIKFWVLR